MTTRNLPTVPRLTAPLDQVDVDALMRTIRQLQDAVRAMPHETELETTIQAPTAADFRIATRLQVAPRSVMLAQMVQTAPTYGSAQIAGSLRWTFDRGDLVLPDFASLTGTATYQIRLRIVEA